LRDPILSLLAAQVSLQHLAAEIVIVRMDLHLKPGKVESLFPCAAIQVFEGCISDHAGTSRFNSIRNSRDILVSSCQADGTSAQEKPVASRGKAKRGQSKRLTPQGKRIGVSAMGRNGVEALSLATGNWQLATGNWQLATGNWQLATGNWQLATGRRRPHADSK
jgi:hypothetical protein